ERVVAHVLVALHRQRPGFALPRDIHLQGVVDVGYVLSAELHVHDGADDPCDPAGRRARGCLAARGGAVGGCGHDTHSFPAAVSASALAPPTLSLISLGVSALRALFASRGNCSRSPLALSVPGFIAPPRAADS